MNKKESKFKVKFIFQAERTIKGPAKIRNFVECSRTDKKISVSGENWMKRKEKQTRE